MIDEIAARFPYWATGVLLAVGLYGMIGKRNLVKKLIGMNSNIIIKIRSWGHMRGHVEDFLARNACRGRAF